MLANRRSILRNARCVWRLFQAMLHPAPMTLPADGIAPPVSPVAASFITGVRHLDLETDLELLLLLPNSMRHLC
jgi:hypothetical protein